jgi:hypothetical protein
MTKRELIDEIIEANPTADAGFLAQFSTEDLHGYLGRLDARLVPNLIGNADRFDHYFHWTEGATSESLSVQPQVAEAPAVSVATAVLARHDIVMDLARIDIDPDCPEGDDPNAETMEFEPITVAEPCIDILPDELAVEETVMDEQLVLSANQSISIDDESEAWLF